MIPEWLMNILIIIGTSVAAFIAIIIIVLAVIYAYDNYSEKRQTERERRKYEARKEAGNV